MNFLVRTVLLWGVNAAGLALADWMLDGIVVDPEWRVITAGAVFGVINWIVKPLLKGLATPVIWLTLGVGLFFVNLAAMYIVAAISSGFEIVDFGGAVGATFLMWLFNAVIHAYFGLDNRRRERASD